ncbi:hypothetical protein TrRE_jg9048 [Triparma retinervis]|uniref:Bidirectional sugar transporter SWEET n=1 Tax=Triparma retinervis TaxID=2557542 RepID=A0A9W6ZM73_9STRA|nr:hypothetical protein TrRE_jg9048 [Triparma retinervis]
MITPAPHPFVVFAGNVAPLTSILLTLSPLPTLLSVPRADSVGFDDDDDDDKVSLLPSSTSAPKNPTSKVTIASLPLLPYSSMAVNGSLWLMYGLLLQAKPLIFPNAVGACLAISYIFLFALKSSPREGGRHFDMSRKMAAPPPSLWTRIDLPSTFRTHLTVGTSILILGFTCLKGGLRNQLAALATLVCGVMFISPLAKIGSIVKNKSCPPGAIPLPFTVATAVNCFLWSVYGIKGVKDIAVTAPNVFGLFCAFTQAIVVFLYSPKGKGKGSIAIELP